MDTNYDGFTVNESSKYETNKQSSDYKPQLFVVSSVGSSSNSNSTLIAAVCCDQIWPVSQLGDKLQQVDKDIKQSDYAGWPVNVLDLPNESPDSQILTTKEKLDQTREIFGLSISHLANILYVSRPTLHAWLDGSNEPRDQSVERIKQIYDISQLWKNKSTFHYPPGRLMRQPLGDAPSMQENLARDILIDVEINESLDKLLELMQRQRSQMDLAIIRSQDSTLSQKNKEKTRHSLTSTIYSE